MVAAIVILTLQVWRKYAESIETISYWLYFAVTVWDVLLILAFIAFISYIVHCLNHMSTTSESSSECYNATEAGVICNAAAFTILSLTLLVVVVPLFKSLRDLRKGNMQLTHSV